MPPFAPSHNPNSSPPPGDQDEDNLLSQGSDEVTKLAADILKQATQKQKCGSVNTKGTKRNENPWKIYGQNYLRQGALYTAVDSVIKHGIDRELRDEDDNEDEDEDEDVETAKTRKRNEDHLNNNWKTLKSIIPLFEESIMAVAHKPELLGFFSAAIMSGADSARSNDTGRLKREVHDYLLDNPDAPLSRLPSLKQSRGFKHNVTASLLTPAEYEDNHQTHEECRRRDNGRRVTADMLPQLLYPEGKVFAEEDDYDTDILRGMYPVRVAKHIYMGPESAQQDPGFHQGCRPNAVLSGITTMTPQTIAYAVVQARFAIAESPEWTQIENEFDYEKFYWNIVELCQDEDNNATVKFYNYHVFGSEDGAHGMHQTHGDSDDGEDVSSMAKVKAHRAAKQRRIDTSVSG
ncbi:hypothetical protein BT96DRAFT_944385 [Gymnopus androsaceus JB14]|uniref:Uncharacterized protein n=1 Tax=Gymnopus androsaceus JB14 TaxID=1447944 RepID=A0A6A4H3T6_9AGAR|nr:hypothetical protein BT96DRAFT_944385 [Gymnopus androsaceus JB14]